MMKDYFSGHAKLYATFRPTYPKTLYEFIYQHVREFNSAWDCGTGNGQVAFELASTFKNVEATDISEQQLKNASLKDNIHYTVSRSESTNFPDHSFDLITVAQAIHWFNQPEFSKEVKRVAKPNAVLAVWGYNVPAITGPVDLLIQDYYKNIVGPYWDEARKQIDDAYKSVQLPFNELDAPAFDMKFLWTLEQLEGYLSTWSSTQKFIKEKNHNPLPELILKIKKHWTDNPMLVTFPLFLRIFKIQ